MKCQNCGSELEEGALFCKECGTKVKTVKFCRECGSPLSMGVKFCSNCGAKIIAPSNNENIENSTNLSNSPKKVSVQRVENNVSELKTGDYQKSGIKIVNYKQSEKKHNNQDIIDSKETQ